MKYETLNQLAAKWKEMSNLVLSLKVQQSEELQDLLKETYAGLLPFHKSEMVPKEISKVFLEMEDFLYFSALMEKKEDLYTPYSYVTLHRIIKALENGFFSGSYGDDFPRLKILGTHGEMVFDFEKDSIER